MRQAVKLRRTVATCDAFATLSRSSEAVTRLRQTYMYASRQSGVRSGRRVHLADVESLEVPVRASEHATEVLRLHKHSSPDEVHDPKSRGTCRSWLG